MDDQPFESILVVFQNPAPGRVAAYDDWYTNVHIRDAMRLDGAIATQRFIVHDDQLTLDGSRVVPGHWAHTIYEWASAAKSVAGHHERAGTPAMEISRDGVFTALRDYFYRPRYLSHGWSREAGFRRGSHVLTAMIVPPAGRQNRLLDWLETSHAPATLHLPGFASVGLFTLHEEQSLPNATEFPLVAIYGLSEPGAALRAWEARHAAGDGDDLAGRVERAELTCWQPRIARLRAEAVAAPSQAAAADERRARAAYADRFLSQAELNRLLSVG